MGSTSTEYHIPRAAAAALLIALGAAAGCTSGRAVASTLPDQTPPTVLKAEKPFFVPGETITWSVSLAGVEGGRARLAVGSVGDVDGRKVVVLRAEAESAGLLALVRQARDAVSSWVDIETGLPTRTESETFGLERNVKVNASRFPEPVVEFQVWNRGADAASGNPDGETKRQRLPLLETHDPLSAVLAMRSWAAPRGGRAVMFSLGGVRLWRTELTVERRGDMKTALGPRKIVQIAGVSRRLRSASLEEDTVRPPRTFTVWVTEDDQRIPVQIIAHTEFGDVTVKATSYAVGD